MDRRMNYSSGRDWGLLGELMGFLSIVIHDLDFLVAKIARKYSNRVEETYPCAQKEKSLHTRSS
jgi:hypothetical protein